MKDNKLLWVVGVIAVIVILNFGNLGLMSVFDVQSVPSLGKPFTTYYKSVMCGSAISNMSLGSHFISNPVTYVAFTGKTGGDNWVDSRNYLTFSFKFDGVPFVYCQQSKGTCPAGSIVQAYGTKVPVIVTPSISIININVPTNYERSGCASFDFAISPELVKVSIDDASFLDEGAYHEMPVVITNDDGVAFADYALEVIIVLDGVEVSSKVYEVNLNSSTNDYEVIIPTDKSGSLNVTVYIGMPYSTPSTMDGILYKQVSSVSHVYSVGVDTSTADTDGDGIMDKDERVLKTDKDNEDTDGDGLGDGWEYRNNSDPLVKDDTPEKLAAYQKEVTPMQVFVERTSVKTVVIEDSLTAVLSNFFIMSLIFLALVSFFILRGGFRRGRFSWANVRAFIRVNKEGTFVGIGVGIVLFVMYLLGWIPFLHVFSYNIVVFIILVSLSGLIGGWVDSVYKPRR